MCHQCVGNEKPIELTQCGKSTKMCSYQLPCDTEVISKVYSSHCCPICLLSNECVLDE